MQLRKPSADEAWIGVIGIVLGAIITGLIGLVPYFYGDKDPTAEIRLDIQAGIRGLNKHETFEQKIKQIKRLQRIVSLDKGVQLAAAIKNIRLEIEQQHEFELELIATKNQVKKAEVKRLKELEKAKLAAETEAEKARIEAERIAFEEAAKKEALLLAQKEAEARRLADLKAKQEDARKKQIEKERLAKSRVLQRELQDERICHNRACTSWIIP